MSAQYTVNVGNLFSHSVVPLVTPWTVSRQVPLSMGFPRQECCSGLPFSFSGDLPNRGTEPTAPVSPALSGEFFTTECWERGFETNEAWSSKVPCVYAEIN